MTSTWFQSDSARSSLNTPNGEAATSRNGEGEEDKKMSATIRRQSAEEEEENGHSRKNNAPSSHLIKAGGTKGFPGRVSSNSNIAGMSTIAHQGGSTSNDNNKNNNNKNNNRPLSPGKTTSQSNANDLLLRFFDSNSSMNGSRFPIYGEQRTRI